MRLNLALSSEGDILLFCKFDLAGFFRLLPMLGARRTIFSFFVFRILSEMLLFMLSMPLPYPERYKPIP
jgi:hypothetical protein